MLRPGPVTGWNVKPAAPVVHAGGYVDETAVLIGEVIVHPDSIVYPQAVLRADEGGPIEIGPGTNVQDGVIMHALLGSDIRVGPGCCVAHGAIVHGPCRVGAGSFIGFRATLLNTEVGAGCFIGHHAAVLNVRLAEGRYVPPGTVVSSQDDADRLGAVGESQRQFVRGVREANEELRKGYLAQAGL